MADQKGIIRSFFGRGGRVKTREQRDWVSIGLKMGSILYRKTMTDRLIERLYKKERDSFVFFSTYISSTISDS